MKNKLIGDWLIFIGVMWHHLLRSKCIESWRLVNLSLQDYRVVHKQ